MIARPTILVHDDRIALRGIEVLRFNKPTIQHDALGGRKLEEFFLSKIIGCKFLFQFMIINQCGEYLTSRLAKCILVGIIQIAPNVDEVFEVLTEDGMIHPSLLREYLHLSALMGHHHLLVRSSLGIGSKESIASHIIEAIDTLHHIFVSDNLTQKLTVEVIQIQVVIAITFTGQKDILVGNLYILESLFLHILVNLILNNQFRYRREWICHIDLQVILMTVQRKDDYLLRIGSRHDARDISISLQRQVDGTCLMRLDIV